MKTINFFRSKLLALTLALVASVSSFAYDEMPDFQVDGLYYNFLEEDNVEVTHPYIPVVPVENVASNTKKKSHAISADDYYNLTNLVIPSTVTYEGKVYNVTRIGFDAFNQCDKLTFVDIPSSVKTIGVGAFNFCSSLTSITLKEGLEHIEWNAFEDCRSLENITFPNSLKTIGNYAFSNTLWYKNHPNGAVYAGNVFYKYKGDIPQNTSFVIKEGTVSISPYAFVKENYHEDYSLVSVSIPNSVEVIGEGAFYRCRALTSIVIPAGVTTIETLAFDYCKALKSVTCEAVNPPALSGSVFLFTPIADATLYVPAESIEAYKTATEWKDFGQILPIKPTSYKSQWCDTWNVMFSNGSVYPPSNTPYRYQLAKDTVIGERTYTAVVQKEINDALDAPRYVAAVRFTDDRKVYIYYDNAEYLLYDFNVQEGDELEVFAGINNYRFGIKTYKCIVTGVEQYACIGCPATITLHVPNHPDDFTEIYRRTQWQEGVGDVYSGFLNGVNGYVPVDGGGSVHLLCAYKGDELKYTGMFHENYGCGDDAEQTPEDLFPTLWGLQRTEVEFHTDGASAPSLVSFNEYTPTLINGKWYLYDGRNYLREENNQVLLYSPEFEIYEDVVLYDWTLEIGDTLPFTIRPFDDDKSRGAVFRVTDVSTITLLDGNEYKKWTLACGIEYIEGIGAINGEGFGNYFCIQHTAHPATYIDTRLVCASRNGQLLYKMDDAEMERLGAECLCDVEKKWTDTWCDTWNVLEHDRQYSGNGNYNEQTWRHYLAQDTIINGQTYTWVNCYWTLEESKVYRIALVRFTEDKKVYLLSGNQEQLVYDFSVEVGDTIETIVGAFYGNARQQLVVHQVDVDDATNRKTITLYPLCKLEEDFDCDQCDENGYYLSECCPVQWIEGVGSTDGFLMGDLPCSDWVGGVGCNLLCAYKNDELQYISKLYQGDYGCEYNAVEQNAADLFPTLWGLQQTICSGYYGEEGDEWASGLTGPSQEITMMDGKPYLQWGSWYLREENDKILVYSEIQKKDLVLYDFTLELGDTLTTLNLVTPEFLEYEGIVGIVDYPLSDYDYTYPIDTLVVTELSKETLLDGKEYTRWKFSDGTVYVEGIGSMSETFFHHIADHLPVPVSYLGSYLVCVSKNGKLLYQMDDVEMERLGAECLCEYDRGPRKDNAKDGQIGGRPTPTQWNQLELDLREMDNGTTILRAETFSYTLENDSVVANDKIFYQLARQSTKDTATTKSFVGALHFGKDEDNRVYFLRDGVEYVLYDFTAEPGDTVEIFAGINNYPQDSTYTHVVVDKDTTEDGACRMFLEVVFPEETTTATNAEKVWLAGLGSVDGIVHNAATRTSNAHATPARSANSETQTSVMLCAWREDSCLYITDHPDYNDIGCIYNQDPTSIEDTHSPSPTTDYQKLLRDGQLLIIHKGKTYNVLGVQIK